jgi:hypothetical protein
MTLKSPAVKSQYENVDVFWDFQCEKILAATSTFNLPFSISINKALWSAMASRSLIWSLLFSLFHLDF